ncbi:unnamed protein product [Gongylonema pulchrum]|uniref:Rab-GAP TBC domain-containing protein n=1 Tax=Gongylonema pulchrum TaxID=637853 RepID=A0A183E6T6_9BILA|nr:unnamed protein product [Gongylonema pulchrum]
MDDERSQSARSNDSTARGNDFSRMNGPAAGGAAQANDSAHRSSNSAREVSLKMDDERSQSARSNDSTARGNDFSRMNGPAAGGSQANDSAQRSSNSAREVSLKVVKFESVTERERLLHRLSLGRSPTKMPTQLIHPADEDESDSDEPLLSGSGIVNQDCSEDVLSAWNKVLEEWKADPEWTRPKELADLIRNGVPDVLRGEVWQYLAKVQIDPDLTDTYRLLLGKMPEDLAFCTLVKIMFDYGLRDLFKLGLDVLHLRFYQLQRLTEVSVPSAVSPS